MAEFDNRPGDHPHTVEGDLERAQEYRRLTGNGPGVNPDDREEAQYQARQAGDNHFSMYLIESEPQTTELNQQNASDIQADASALGNRIKDHLAANENDRYFAGNAVHEFLSGATTPEEQARRLLVIAAIPEEVEGVNLSTPTILNRIQVLAISSDPQVAQAAAIALAALDQPATLQRFITQANQPFNANQLQQFADMSEINPDLGETVLNAHQLTNQPRAIENQLALMDGLMNIEVENDGTTSHPYRGVMLDHALDLIDNAPPAGLLAAEQRAFTAANERIANWMEPHALELAVSPTPEGEEAVQQAHNDRRARMTTFLIDRMKSDEGAELTATVIEQFGEASTDSLPSEHWRSFIQTALENEDIAAHVVENPAAMLALHNFATQPTPEGLEGADLTAYNETRQRIATFVTGRSTSAEGGPLARSMFDDYAIALREGTLDPNEAALIDAVLDNPQFRTHISASADSLERALVVVQMEVPEDLEGDARADFVARQQKLREIVLTGMATETGDGLSASVIHDVRTALAGGNPSGNLAALFDTLIEDEDVLERVQANPEAARELASIMMMSPPEGLEGADLEAWNERQTKVRDAVMELAVTPGGAPMAQAAFDTYFDQLMQTEDQPIPQRYIDTLNSLLANDVSRGHVLSYAASQTIGAAPEGQEGRQESMREWLVFNMVGEHGTEVVEIVLDQYHREINSGVPQEGVQETVGLMVSDPILGPIITQQMSDYADRLEADGNPDRAAEIRDLLGI